jgi:hypothetical protein
MNTVATAPARLPKFKGTREDRPSRHFLAVREHLVVQERADSARADLDMHSVLQPGALGSRWYPSHGGLGCARCIRTDVNFPDWENLPFLVRACHAEATLALAPSKASAT